MTKKELIEQMAPFNDDAEMLVSIEVDVFYVRGVRMEWTSHDGKEMVEDPTQCLITVKV